MKVPPLPRTPSGLFSAYTQGLSSTELERIFTRDTADAYKFFSRHLDFDALQKLPWHRRIFTQTRLVFLAFTMKLSPGRRALYGLSLMATAIGLVELFQGLHLLLLPHPAFAPGTLWLLTGFLLLNLLVLIEVADRMSLKNDLEVARQIQLAMLPTGAFHASGLEACGITRPANTVGGDFYDILPLPDGRVLLTLGDVAGKGSPAALLMALLLAMMRTLVDEGFEGPALVERLNHQVMRHAPRSRFVTLFVGILNPETGQFSYVNAGQNPPLIRRVAGGYESLKEGGMAVGMFEHATYTVGTTQMDVGDVLVMFSDGVVEAEDADGVPFDEAGVRSTIDGKGWASARELGWAIFASVQRYTDDRRLLDDLTTLVARRTPMLPDVDQGQRPKAQGQKGSTVAATLALLVLCAGPAAAQTAPADPVSGVLVGLERALATASAPAFDALFGEQVADAGIRIYANDLLRPGVTNAVVKERERAPLEGVPSGDGFRSIVDVFIATPGRGRVLTAGIDTRRPPGGDIRSWRIVGFEGLSSVDGLYRLRLNTNRQFGARNLTVASEDLQIVLEEGSVFLVDSDDGVTGLVLLGRGTMRFSPGPVVERGQLRIFSGTESLAASFDSAFIRLSPGDYARRVTTDRLVEQPVDTRMARRAQGVFTRESAKSFNVDLQDLSRDTWHLLPPAEDFVAEVNTQRFDTLTFSRASAQAEDVSLFQREERRTIALYPSVAKLAARGRFYSDDATREYDVLDYNLDVSVLPEREYIEGRARLQIRVRSTSLSNVMLRLDDRLNVRNVTSVEYGPLLHLRVRSQNVVLVSLPGVVPQDSDLTLIVTYAGPIESQALDVDTIAVEPDFQDLPPPSVAIEPHTLLSNRIVWYPQNPVSDYATGTVRVTVPQGYRAIATGAPVPASTTVSLRDLLTQPNGTSFTFRADQPLRYMGIAVARFVRVDERTVKVDTARPGTDIESVTVAVETHPRIQSRGRQVAVQAQNIMAFFSSVVGEAPFTAMTIGLVESETPGGHSPGYFALLNEPQANPNITWRADPAAFDNFPEFFLAHELAHQWWGQAVGWKNYHEQWLSEGFAQYFAAMWAQRSRGDRVFVDMLRQFRRWSLAESDQGPVHLGYRLGHIKRDLRVYRALVYNKGASVLHMLRRLLGDETFFRGLRAFYEDRRFQKAGTDDFERVLEAESGRTLDRFFERWIHGTEIPRVAYRTTSTATEVRVRFEQRADLVFDLPVTVTITGTDGQTRDVVVELSEAVVEHSIPVDGPVRQVQVNRDGAALAEFDQR